MLYSFMYQYDLDHKYETSQYNKRETYFNGQSHHFSVTITQVEVIYFFVYGCDVDHIYKKLRSNSGGMFEQTITSFATSQLFGYIIYLIYKCDLGHGYETINI